MLATSLGRTARLAELSARPWSVDRDCAVRELRWLADAPGTSPAIRALSTSPDQEGAPARLAPGTDADRVGRDPAEPAQRELRLLSGSMEWPWRVKLKQANLHLLRYGEAASTYLAEANVHLEYPKDHDAGTIDVVLRADLPPPGLLGAIIGDVLHNLRSALDSIAWASCQEAGVPGEKEHLVYFPITWHPGEWLKVSKKQLPGVPAMQLKEFESLQPWYHDEQARGLNIDVPHERAQKAPLWQIHSLAKVDRHRMLTPLLARINGTWLGTPEDTTASIVKVFPGPWKPDDVVMRWGIMPPEALERVSPAGEVTLTLREPTDLQASPAQNELASMIATTRSALQHIEIAVLEVVTREELANLALLSEAYRLAEEDVAVDIRERGTWDMASVDRSEGLRRARDEARNRWQARSVEIFE